MQPAALSGLRVIEISDDKGAYCGKLFADMGADVIKIEPPGGDPARLTPPFWHDRTGPQTSLSFLYLNTSKRGITLDLSSTAGRDLFRRLSDRADLVIETFAPGHLDELGIGPAALRERNPRLVVTSITGFGQSGPHRHFKSCDLVASALGGSMQVTGDAEDPPVRLAGEQCHVMASTCAAAASMFALQHAARTGAGQHVDISVLEVAAAVTHICGVGKWLDDRIVPRRRGTGLFASVPSGAYRCRDGLVYLAVNRPLHWKALAEWIAAVTGNPAALDPLFEGPSSSRQPHRDLLDIYISDLTSRFTVDEVYREGQRRHIAFTPVHTPAAVAADRHLAAREYFVEVNHPDRGALPYPGAPYRHARTPWRISRPAPQIGEHNEEVYCGELGLARRELEELERFGTVSQQTLAAPAGAPVATRKSSDRIERAPGVIRHRARSDAHPRALEGIRVVELTAGMAGPWIGRFMAHSGAEVIKIESRGHPDVTRLYVPPWAPELGIQPQLSPWFTDWNAGKRFVGLDLGRPEAVELAKRLVARSDLLVENYSTGVLAKLGLDYAELVKIKPDIIVFSSSGYGDSGPDARYVTWGPNIEALSGLSTVSGFPHRECTITQYAYPDAASALHGLFAVLCALDHRRRTGEGQYINLSQYEATVASIGHVMMEYLANRREPPRLGNRSRRAAPHGCYRCRGDERWCVIAIFDDAEWVALCQAIGRPEWLADPRLVTREGRAEHENELDALLEGWTSEHDPYDAMNLLQSAGVAAAVVQNVEDQLLRDAQLAARAFFEEIEHVKKGEVLATGIPVGLSATPGRTTQAGAAVGQDNDYVFGEIGGLSREEVEAYVRAGVIETADR